MTRTNIESRRANRGPEFPILQVAAVAVLLTTFASSSSDIISGLRGNILAFGSYLAFLGAFSYYRRAFSLPVFPATIIGFIYVIFVLNAVRHFLNLIPLPAQFDNSLPLVETILYLSNLFGYILGSLVVLFLIPKTFRRKSVFTILTAVSTFSIFIGLPAYIIGDYTILSMNVNTYTHLEPFRQYGIYIPALSSIWDDANAMSKIVAAGIIGSHYLHTKYRTWITASLLSFNVFGLVLANSKMGMIAICSAYSVYLVYVLLGERATYAYLIITGTASILAFTMIVLGLRTESFVASVGFSGRVALWRGSLATLVKYPVLGVGILDVGQIIASHSGVAPLAPQNSYLRILVATGIVGGLSYIIFVVTTALRYVQQIAETQDCITFVLLITFMIMQFTDTGDPFGINKNALIFGLALGYAIKAVYSGTPADGASKSIPLEG